MEQLSPAGLLPNPGGQTSYLPIILSETGRITVCIGDSASPICRSKRTLSGHICRCHPLELCPCRGSTTSRCPGGWGVGNINGCHVRFQALRHQTCPATSNAHTLSSLPHRRSPYTPTTQPHKCARHVLGANG